jgi:hypothetical protein
MRMASETPATEFPHQGDQIAIPIHRLDGAEAEARQSGALQKVPNEFRQSARRRLGGREIPTPAAEVDSRKDEFLASGGYELLDVSKDGCGGQTFGGAARLWNNAR